MTGLPTLPLPAPLPLLAPAALPLLAPVPLPPVPPGLQQALAGALTHAPMAPVPGCPYVWATASGLLVRIRHPDPPKRWTPRKRRPSIVVLRTRAQPSTRKHNGAGADRQRLNLWMDGERQTKFVHVLVCLAFWGPAPEWAPICAHRNGICTDNRPTNLRWSSPTANELDRKYHALYGVGSVRPGDLLDPEEPTLADLPLDATPAPAYAPSEEFGF